MDEKEILELAEQEKTYWWHIVRRAILQSVLNRFLLCYCSNELRTNNLDSSRQMPRTIKILDVGCGTGENFYWLSKFGKVVGVDTSELAVELASQKGITILERALAFAGRAEDLPFEDQTFNLVTAFDVLEHIADENRALGEWKRVLGPSGYLFLSVPAYQWLFGPHDRALSHLRRYNVPQLKRILTDNDFEVIFVSYFFALTFPIFLVQRWLVKFSRQNASQYVRVAPWLNNFMIVLGKLEAAWLKIGVLPFGSSIVVLAQKKDNNPLSSSGDRMFPSVRHAEFISASPRKILKLVQDDGEVTQGDKEETTPRFKIGQQFLKFAIVGVGNTAIDIGLLNLLMFWHWPVMWANTVAFIMAATNGFFLNKYWTFGDKEGKWQIQLPFYLTVAAIGLGLSDGLVYIFSLIFHWDVNVVKILSIGIIGLWNFLAPKFLIFKK